MRQAKFLVLCSTLLVLGGTVLLSAPRAYAEDVLNDICNKNPQAVACQDNQTPQDHDKNSIYGSDSILAKATKLVSFVVGIVAVIMIIIGGLQYIMAAGDSAKVNSAKNTILYAIIGVVVAVMAQIIINFVIRRL
jgi:hypothetical protein